ncbi:hypothetical protein LINGRAHAP2_LOCUS29582 [Linum grandiflorum]
MVKPWSRALVVRVLEQNFSFLAIKRRLENLWAKHGEIQVSDMTNHCYAVRFSAKEDYLLDVVGGPWKSMIIILQSPSGHLILMSKHHYKGC